MGSSSFTTVTSLGGLPPQGAVTCFFCRALRSRPVGGLELLLSRARPRRVPSRAWRPPRPVLLQLGVRAAPALRALGVLLSAAASRRPSPVRRDSSAGARQLGRSRASRRSCSLLCARGLLSGLRLRGRGLRRGAAGASSGTATASSPAGLAARRTLAGPARASAAAGAARPLFEPLRPRQALRRAGRAPAAVRLLGGRLLRRGLCSIDRGDLVAGFHGAGVRQRLVRRSMYGSTGDGRTSDTPVDPRRRIVGVIITTSSVWFFCAALLRNSRPRIGNVADARDLRHRARSPCCSSGPAIANV